MKKLSIPALRRELDRKKVKYSKNDGKDQLQGISHSEWTTYTIKIIALTDKFGRYCRPAHMLTSSARTS